MYAKYSCIIHWNLIAYDKYAMQWNTLLMLRIVLQCNGIKSLMISIVVHCIDIALLMLSVVCNALGIHC